MAWGAAWDWGLERALDLSAAVETGEQTIDAPPAAADEATFESDCGRGATPSG